MDALVAYLGTLAGPGRNALEIAPEVILQGEAVFEAGCAACHPAPLYTDGLTHDLKMDRAAERSIRPRCAGCGRPGRTTTMAARPRWRPFSRRTAARTSSSARFPTAISIC